MRIDYPVHAQIPQLRSLWKEAFGDEDAFLDLFFDTAFDCRRSRCIVEEDTVAAVLYWFDCQWKDRKYAYLYAVATRKDYRGRGLCRLLMGDTAACLATQGYDGALLVPADEGLMRMYGSMGYGVCTAIREFSCEKGSVPAKLRAVGSEEYARLRRQYLPETGVIQEGPALEVLAAQGCLYAGDDFLYATEGELLGNVDAAPAILAALGKERGSFRVPGEDRPFAMYYPITDGPAPGYFGLALD